MEFNKHLYEASLLEKYTDVFPASFIECIKNGVTWLANHNGLTYHTSTMMATDAIVYESNKSSILRIGLINVDKPLTGLTYFTVRSIQEEKDNVNGNVKFRLRLDYTAPIGIEIVMIPIKYFNPYDDQTSNYYTKEEIGNLLNTQKEAVMQEVSTMVTNKITTALEPYKELLDIISGIGGSEDNNSGNSGSGDNSGSTGGSSNSGSSTPGNGSSSTTRPGLGLVEQLHSLSMSIQEVARENTELGAKVNEVETNLTALAQNVEPLLSTNPIEGSSLFYTKAEISTLLDTKVSYATFRDYVQLANEKFALKNPGTDVTPPVPDNGTDPDNGNGDGQGGDTDQGGDNNGQTGGDGTVTPIPPVEPQPTPVTELTLGSESGNVDVNSTLEVTVTTNASTFTVESKDISKATVVKNDSSFTITGVETGNVNIEVKATVDGGSEVTKVFAVTVNAVDAPPVTPAKPTLSVSPTTVTLDVSGTQVLTIEPSEGADFTVDNSDDTKISFDKDTKTLTALAPTTDPVRIGFRPTKDGVNGDMSNVMVTVNQPAVAPTPPAENTKPTLNVTPSTVNVEVNGTSVITIEPSEGADFEVDNSDSTKISFDKDTKTVTGLVATTSPVRLGFRPTKNGVKGDMSNVMVTVTAPATQGS